MDGPVDMFFDLFKNPELECILEERDVICFGW